ncbi:TlyA family RNA methyltransferase [Microaerobacter geothermalis]|uniref:TlyA family RNA methyltransferase n=1 Tax=Microaerobacter geothermalis TaxID=674972 RepID=UPI001F39677A|nr:TlyA family RNA methyltransferase [Microaerobacter geothermalis]MCF6094436.1 TlyA family RNA methyltransferase [Microaerobacter geothermalis]
MTKKKERLDVLLVEGGHFSSREQAKRAIMAGLVFVNNEKSDKPGMKVSSDVKIRVKSPLHPFVSRGGLKLQKAIEQFHIDFKDKVVIDIGASTGGFTDCALQYRAKKVYAVDVGYGQLAWSLRQDPRVIVMERTNFRYLKKEDLSGEPPDVATIDVSFISLSLIFPVLAEILRKPGEMIALIKPQFEAGREHVGKNGLVKDPKIHYQVIKKVIHQADKSGFRLQGLHYSPIKGGEGNIEFLYFGRYNPENWNLEEVYLDDHIKNVVKAAHNNLSDS